jgi:hypothetical protein
MLAIDARAQTTAWRRARYRPNTMRPETVGGVLGVGPWKSESADTIVEALRSALAADLATNASSQGLLPLVPAIFRSNSANCIAVSR